MSKQSVLNIKISRRPKIGDLVICKKLVVLCTGYGNHQNSYKCFSGVVIIPDDDFQVGTYSRTWDCAAFEKLNCKINLLPMNIVKTPQP